MVELKPGARLRSLTCATQVVVVSGSGEVELTCGGVAMAPLESTPSGEHVLAEGLDQGSQVGKRYVDEAGTIEVLCTHAGEGTLGVGLVPLTIKGAKPLPSSD
jgi:hypothetical protein